MKRDKDHTVSYKPIDYYCLGETQKARVREMEKAGISTHYDSASTPEAVEGHVAKRGLGGIVYF